MAFDVLRRKDLFVLQLLDRQSIALKDPVESGRSEGLKVAKDGQKVPKVAQGEVSEHVPDIARDQRKLLAAIGDPVGVDSDLLKVHQDLSVAPRFLGRYQLAQVGYWHLGPQVGP